MPKGRPPKPTALRLLDGDRKDRINTSEPIPLDVLPECPAEVADEVREIWDYTVAHLDTMGLAKACDRDALLAYCEAVVNHRKASAILAKSPVLVRGQHGTLVRNPALVVQLQASVTLRAFAQEFGLTPSARSRIETRRDDSDVEENPFAGTG